MTAEALVYSVLKVLCEGRIYPDVAPSETALPYITYQSVGGQPVNFITGDKPSRSNTRMQLNVWAKTREDASGIGAQVEDIMRAATELQTEVLTGRLATYDEDTTYRGTIQDFSIWSDQ